jgi:phenylpropionate dioxygenase-like ring-hydroxylating dioxygenase large terminal subunit
VVAETPVRPAKRQGETVIPNQWYAILESNEVRRGRVIGVTRLGERLAVWRDEEGRVTAMHDQCPHRGAALSGGQVVSGHVECPFHGFLFDGGGCCDLIPANGRTAAVPSGFRVRAYPTQEAHGFIWMFWAPGGEPRGDLPPPPYFDDLGDEFHYTTIRDPWPVHYSRAIENQLDVVHLPFVHRTTIGRGERTIIDGPQVQMDGDLMNIWVYNRPDDGRPPLRPDELPEPARPPFLQFRFPHIWQNRISDTLRIFIAFTPVDEDNTMLYIRYCQAVVRVPILRGLFGWLGKVSSRVIANQDKRVVVTQRPIKSQARMSERLVQGDRPILLYRRRRQALIDAASGASGTPRAE